MKCPICNSEQVYKKFHYSQEEIGSGIDIGETSIYVCSDCGGGFLHPMPSENALSNLYQLEYTSYTEIEKDIKPSTKLVYEYNYLGKRSIKHLLSKMFFFGNSVNISSYIKSLEKEPRQIKILDIGSGNGKNVRAIHNLGFDVTGIEPHKKHVEACKKIGLNVVQGFYNEKSFKGIKFDVIYSSHVLEHVDDPFSFIKLIRKNLSDDGIAIIDVPNFSAANKHIFGRYFLHLAVPVHLFHYTKKSLKHLVENLGFAVSKTLTYSSGTFFPSLYIKKSLQKKMERWTDFSIEGFKYPYSKFFFLKVLNKIFGWISDIFGKGDCLVMVLRKK